MADDRNNVLLSCTNDDRRSAQGDTVKGLKKLTENRDWQQNWKMKKGDGDFKRGKEEQNRDIKERSY